MPDLALITGASGGIGREFARLHARKGGDLILAARRTDALAELKAELEAQDIAVDVVACDLGTQAGLEALLAACEGREIGILINNAGFGGRGAFVDRALEEDLAMVDLNLRAVMVLCHAIGGQMAARGHGRILNVGSTAGLIPGPLQATYFATKAFVRSFSFALDEELRDRGVTVTVLAPGYVETEFAARADLEGTPLTKSGKSPASVAKVGYDAMRIGQLEAINEPALGFAARLISLVPKRLLLRQVRKMQTK